MTTLYSIVKEQFPEFVRSDYPAFVEFVQAYYKWLEIQSAGKIEDIADIDTPAYAVYLQSTYLGNTVNIAKWYDQIIVGANGGRAIVKRVFAATADAPITLYVQYLTADIQFVAGEVVSVDGAVNTTSAQVSSVATLPSAFVTHFKQYLDVYGIFNESDPYNVRYLKNIKEIYTSKGSEQALVFLLQTVHNAQVNVKYPSQDILRASDGKWTQERHFTIEVFFGEPPVVPPSSVLVTQGGSDFVLHVAHCETINTSPYRVRIYHADMVDLAINQLVKIVVDNQIHCASRVIADVSYVEVTDGGSNWQLGQLLTFPGTVKDTVARVQNTEVATGQIKHVEIIQVGWDHTADQSITVYPTVAETPGTQATLTLKTAANGRMPGRWGDESGQISNQDIRLQDSFYYQQFSYDIESLVNPAQFTSLAQAVHPAGTKLFTTYILERAFSIIPVIETTYPYKTVGVFDVVITLDDLSFEMTKPLASAATVLDAISLNLNKYLPEDTVLAVAGDTATLTGPFTYDAEIYFEKQGGDPDAYVGLEDVLTIV